MPICIFQNVGLMIIIEFIDFILQFLVPVYACTISTLIVIVLSSYTSSHVDAPVWKSRNVIYSSKNQIAQEISLNSKAVFNNEINIHDVAVDKEINWKQKFIGHWSLLRREGFKEVCMSVIMIL